MVRRLPVLQNQPPPEVRFSVVQAVGAGVMAVLLSWAVLLWALHRFGGWGVATSFVLSCALVGVLVGSRVDHRDLWRTLVWTTSAVVGAVWAIAWVGGALSEVVAALSALVALALLAGSGFAVGIAVLFWRRRSFFGRRQ